MSAPRNVIIVAIVCGIGFGSWLFLRTETSPVRTDCDTNPALQTKDISAGETQVRAEVVESGADKAKGLSGRNCLNPDSGMLFMYELSGDYCYWMKDMNFSIDMIWLDDEKRIVTIQDSVAPETYPQSFCPDKPARYVLEVPAGFAARSGWNSDTTLNWQ